MLKEIFIENYKSLKNTRVEFKDGLNIIIGKNGSGKSNLLEFIKSTISIGPFLPKTNTKNKFPEYDFNYLFTYEDSGKEIVLFVETKNENKILDTEVDSLTNVTITKKYANSTDYLLNASFSFTNTHFNIQKDDRNKLLTELQFIKSLNTEIIKFNDPSKLSWLSEPNKYTVSLNLISINNEKIVSSRYFFVNGIYGFYFSFNFERFFEKKLNSLKIDPYAKNAVDIMKSLLFDSFIEYKLSCNIDDSLSSFSPIEEVRINQNVNVYQVEDKFLIENLTLEFKINDAWMPWSNLSDGTKRLFYIIAEISTQEDGLILIEEPELGIHPHQLFLLMNFIKEQSQSKQIIISTHSPIVLDALSADELDRITIAKIENGKSRFYKLTEKEMTDAKEYMEEVADLSYYWQHSDLESND